MLFLGRFDREGAGSTETIMSKNIKIDDRTHVRIKKLATSKGRLVGHMADELLNTALDAAKKPTLKTERKP